MNKKQSINDGGVNKMLQLPDHLVDRIISFLPLKDAVRTSILSKRWENLWITASPKLELYTAFFGCEPRGMRDGDINAIKRVDFLNFVERTLRLCHSHSHNQNVSIPKLELYLPVYLSEVATTLDRCIRYAIGCNAKELNLDINFLERGLYDLSHTVFTAKSLTKLSLYGCNLEFSSCSFSSLKILTLLDVFVDDQILQNLIANCPVIEDLQLLLYSGSNRILKISGLVNPNLKYVVIWGGYTFERVEIEAPGLESFCFGRVGVFEDIMPMELNLSTCKNMRELFLYHATITDVWFHDVIRKLGLLERLNLICCDMLESIKLSSLRLKYLELSVSRRLFNVEIDVPNLSRFSYHGSDVISFSSNALALLKADISLNPTTVDTHWYVRLTEFLGKFNNSKDLTLHSQSVKDLIVPKEFRDSLMPPLYNVESLMLESHQVLYEETVEELLGQSVEETVDGLLWLSPHPVSLSITLEMKTLELKFFYKEIDGERHPCCCSSLPITCWRHCLKEVQVASPGWLEEEDERKIKSFIEHKSELLMEIDGFTTHTIKLHENGQRRKV